jgi:predicted nucleotidyltransferase
MLNASGELPMELELNEDFKDLLKLFKSNKVRYLLIGGYAVIVHGHPRLTNDLDLVIGAELENVERCLKALREFGFGEGDVSPDMFSKPKSIVRMGVEPVRIEILNFLEGVDFESAYERRELRPAEDIQFDVISLPDLIANKRTVGRDKDLLDVKELTKVNG